MAETLVHLTDETEAPSKPKRVKVCAGETCEGKHRGRCKAKNSPWRKMKVMPVGTAEDKV